MPILVFLDCYNSKIIFILLESIYISKKKQQYNIQKIYGLFNIFGFITTEK